MEKTCSYDVCTGCGVCKSVCPKHCISLFHGDFGHVFPKIDTSVCIDCKKCEKVCPAINDTDRIEPTIAYAAIIKDKKDYETTTSGGAAQALSLYTINKGGVVYGCASLHGAKVEHIRVETVEKLELLKGSKYVQSKVDGIYEALVEDVKNGRETLFIGTPCQTAAVKSLFFKKLPDNLLLVDLICHGVPSQIFLSSYLKKKGVDLDRIDRLWFRTEEGYQMIAAEQLEQGAFKPVYKSVPMFKKILEDIYYGLFFHGYSYRKSCYTCKFASSARCGDITIGDFWGLGKMGDITDIPSHPNGISLILPITAKGIRTVGELDILMDLYERPVKEAIDGNDQLRAPKYRDASIRTFDMLRKIVGINAAFRIATIHKTCKAFIKNTILNHK